MTITKTEMLEACEKIHFRITEVLFSWVEKEANNLEGFIDNPSGHIEYNPYIIPDYTKIYARLDMLKSIAESLRVITEFKKGNPDYTRSMYESHIDNVHVVVIERLFDWLKKRHADMTEMIVTNKANQLGPIQDYYSMFTFNQEKFMQEYQMYSYAIEGCKVVMDYKKQVVYEDPVSSEFMLNSNEPPLSGGA